LTSPPPRARANELEDALAPTSVALQALEGLATSVAQQGSKLERLTAGFEYAEQARGGSFRRETTEQVSAELGPIRNAIIETRRTAR